MCRTLDRQENLAVAINLGVASVFLLLGLFGGRLLAFLGSLS